MDNITNKFFYIILIIVCKKENDKSGTSVSLNSEGNFIVIGAGFHSGSAPNYETDEIGQVRFFQWDGNNWINIVSDIDGSERQSGTGYSVRESKDGKMIAIGSKWQDKQSFNDNFGKVEVFKYLD